MLSWLTGNDENNNNEWYYENIPTPMSKEEYVAIGEQALSEVMDVVSSEGWNVLHEKDGVLIEDKYVDGSDVTAIRVSTVLTNVNVDKIVQFIHSPTFEQRKPIYDKLIDHKIVEVVEPWINVAHSKFTAPFGVTNRDFLAMRCLGKQEDGTFVIACRSINRSDVPFDNDNYVRGVSNSNIYVFPIQKEDGTSDVRVVSVDHVDPKGWVPTAVVNSFKATMGDWLIKLQKAYGNDY